MNLSAIPWDFILILTVLGVLVPWRGAVRIRRLLAQPELTTSQRLSLYASTITFQWLLVAVIAWRSFSRHLSSLELGLAVPEVWHTASVSAALTALLCVNQWAGLRKIARAAPDQRRFLPQFTTNIIPHTLTESLAFVALACTAGLSEEFIYRGFVFTVFYRTLAHSAFPAATAMVVSSAWFAMAHLYQGCRGVITTFVVGILFCAMRIWTGNLIPAMAAHIGVDLIAGLYGPRLLRDRSNSGVACGPLDAKT